jgi:hypothetical protein
MLVSILDENSSYQIEERRITEGGNIIDMLNSVSWSKHFVNKTKI